MTPEHACILAIIDAAAVKRTNERNRSLTLDHQRVIEDECEQPADYTPPTDFPEV